LSQTGSVREEPKIPGWYGPFAIFFIALLLRVIYIWDISDNPFFTDLIIDLKAYDDWAREIAAGNWIGNKVFYQSPLYPYFLAVLYSGFGRSLILVYILQAILGALDCLVIYATGKEVFDRRVGIIAGLGAAIYKMFIFYQALILKTFLGLLMIDLALWLILLCGRKKIGPSPALLAGISLGLAALVRDNVIVLIPFFGLWLFIIRRGEPLSSRLRPILIWSASLLLVLGLCLARNYYAGRDWVLTTSQGGQNFYIGNHRGNYWGTYKAPDFVRANPEFEEKDFRAEAARRTGRAEFKPSELSQYWYGQAFREIRADPGLFILRLFRKTLIFLNREEVPDNLNYYLYRTRFSIILKLPLLNFAVLAPLGILGMLLCMRDRKAMLLALYVFIYSATVILFFVLARYRLFVAGPLLVFAGYALVWLWKKLRAREFLSILPELGILLVFIALTEIPLHKPGHAGALYNLGNAYARQDNWVKALDAYKDALKDDPENIHILINLGKALTELGDIDQAVQVFEKAVKIKPDYLPGRLNLGIALYRKNQPENAIIHFKRIVEKDPKNITALVYLAEISIETGDLDSARNYLNQVLEIEPENPWARASLERLRE
jgi:tetratricopeptide (TPR) repeat protein